MRAQAVRRSEEEKRREDVEMTNAVTKIQSHRRAQLGRRDVKEKKSEKERARLAKEAEQAALARERERRALEQKLEEMQMQKRASTASKAVEKQHEREAIENRLRNIEDKERMAAAEALQQQRL